MTDVAPAVLEGPAPYLGEVLEPTGPASLNTTEVAPGRCGRSVRAVQQFVTANAGLFGVP